MTTDVSNSCTLQLEHNVLTTGEGTCCKLGIKFVDEFPVHEISVMDFEPSDCTKQPSDCRGQPSDRIITPMYTMTFS